MINIGLRIKQLRQEQGLTQTELGKKIGVKKVTINKYEQNRTKHLGIDVIEKIANALNVPPMNLLGYNEKTIDLNDSNLSMFINGCKLNANQMNQVRKTAINCTNKKLKVDLDKTDYEFVYKGREISKSDWKFVQKILENLTK